MKKEEIPMTEYVDTYCPECGEMVIRRTGYRVHVSGLSGNRCNYCGHRLNIIR